MVEDRENVTVQDAPGAGSGALQREAPGPELGQPRRGLPRIPLVIGVGVVAILALGALMVWRAAARTNKISLASLPTPVTTVPAKAATFRASRTYVGTLRPWVEADVGPQFISAYVDSVLVRPGAVVKRGAVLATLDCRHSAAAAQAIASQARAIEARQKALADEAARTQRLLSGGFVSANSVEMKLAHSAAEAAQLEAEKANLDKSRLSVDDCVLRSPFDGEVGVRLADPGAFVRPSSTIVSVVDRSTVRMTVDVPEADYGFVAPGTAVRVHVISTGMDVPAAVSRRAPSADPGTRTVHVEIDIPDPARRIPVNTTGEVHVDVGQPVAATSVPVYAASVTSDKATVFTVEGDVAHSVTAPVMGEIGGDLYFAPDQLKAGSMVVIEGRALLSNGSRVVAKETAVTPRGSSVNVITSPDEPAAGKKEPPAKGEAK